jgi:hypothetical protein
MRVCLLSMLCIASLAGELLPPRGLRPMVQLVPEASDGPALQLRALLAGRPLHNFILRVRASRTSPEVIASAVSDEHGALQLLLPADSANRRLALHGHMPRVRMPVWSQLTWSSPQEFGVHGDSTEQISTAMLGMWELRDGGAHVFFGWPQQQEAEALLAVLVEQRKRLRKFLGIRLEPMGAVLVVRDKDFARFRTVSEGHTLRHGKWIHGVRSWPLFGGSMEAIANTFDEDRELTITLPHELAENSLIFAESAGIAHEGTRWFRDGVAESAAAFCAWDRPKLLAEHLRTRLNDLERNEEAEMNLLEWQQDSNPGTLARYAAATAWVLKHVRAQPDLVAKVARQAAAADRIDSAGLVAALNAATGDDCESQLRTMKKTDVAEQLGDVIRDLEARAPFRKPKK